MLGWVEGEWKAEPLEAGPGDVAGVEADGDEEAELVLGLLEEVEGAVACLLCEEVPAVPLLAIMPIPMSIELVPLHASFCIQLDSSTKAGNSI